MRKIVVLIIALVLASTPQVASAHYLSHPDPRDTPRGLDVARVRLRSPDRDLIGKVVLFGLGNRFWRWHLEVDFDSRGDERMDFFLGVGWDVASGGFYESSLYRRGGQTVNGVRARWVHEVIRFRFPESLLEKTRRVRWKVTLSSLNTKRYTEGLDLAPNAGWYEH